MSYSSNYTNRATIFDAGDTMEGDHIEAVYEELGPSPSRIFEGLGVPYKSGAWWSAAQSFTTGGTATAGTLFIWPMVLTRTVGFDKISAYVSSAGSSGTTVRMGIFNSDSNGMPTSLVANSEVTQDGAVVNTTTPSGVAFSSTISLGRGRYYLGVVSQGSGTMPTTSRGITSMFTINSASTTNFSTIIGTRAVCFSTTGVTGALPSSLSSSTLITEATGTSVGIRMV